MSNDDKSLVKALHRGDKYACNDLVKQFSGKIYNVALRLTGHPVEAEEVLQETFISACKNAETFQGKSSLGTWLYRIATNNGLMRLRKRELPTISFDASAEENGDEFWPNQLQNWDWNPETVALESELQQIMDEAVASLPDSLRVAFVLRDLEGLSTREAAETLGISPGNMKIRLHRARFMLRERLSLYFSEQGEHVVG